MIKCDLIEGVKAENKRIWDRRKDFAITSVILPNMQSGCYSYDKGLLYTDMIRLAEIFFLKGDNYSYTLSIHVSEDCIWFEYPDFEYASFERTYMTVKIYFQDGKEIFYQDGKNIRYIIDINNRDYLFSITQGYVNLDIAYPKLQEILEQNISKKFLSTLANNPQLVQAKKIRYFSL